MKNKQEELELLLTSKKGQEICNFVSGLKEKDVEYSMLILIYSYILNTDKVQTMEISKALFNNEEIQKKPAFKSYIQEEKKLIYIKLLGSEWIEEAKKYEVYINKSDISDKINYQYRDSYKRGLIKTIEYLEEKYPYVKYNTDIDDLLYNIAGNFKNAVQMLDYVLKKRELTKEQKETLNSSTIIRGNAQLLQYLLVIPDNEISVEKKEEYLASNVKKRDSYEDVEIMDVLTKNLLLDKNYQLPNYIYKSIKSVDEELTQYIDKVNLYNKLENNVPKLPSVKSKKL